MTQSLLMTEEVIEVPKSLDDTSAGVLTPTLKTSDTMMVAIFRKFIGSECAIYVREHNK